jgi:polysaccharide biosynthesis transport protein
MSFSQILLTLKARWLSGLVALAVVLGASMLLAALLPKRYTATASVVVDVRSPDPITGMALQGLGMPSYMATQVDVLQSGRTARRVIQTLGLNNNAQLRQQWLEEARGKGEFEGWIVELLSDNLTVRPRRESNALSISYRSADERFSATMANAFAQAFIDTNLELRTAPAREFAGFFDERAKQSREALEAAQTKLSAYQRENGIIANDERLDVETARLQELSTQVVMLQTLAAEASGRASQAALNGDRLQEVVTNPMVGQLNVELSRQLARLEELNSRLGDQNPQVVEVKAQVNELRSRIASETRRVAGSVTVNNSVVQTRLAQAQSSLAEQRARVLRLKQQRDEATVLQREIEIAQQAYQTLVQRQNLTAVEAKTTQTNVSFLERAYEPSEPSSPRPWVHAIVGTILGLMLATAVMLIRELRDRRLRSVDDVSEVLALPMLGVLPKATPQALARSAQASVVRRKLLGGLSPNAS